MTRSAKPLRDAVRPVVTAPVATAEPPYDPSTETGTGSLRWPEASAHPDFSIGIEEEAMLIERDSARIAHRSEEVLDRVGNAARNRVTAETQDSAIEIATGVHRSVADATAELAELRRCVADELEHFDLRAAVAGTHPTAVWEEIEISPEKRYEQIHDAMRELARREPTFALHLHIGVADADAAIRLFDRMRTHLPMLLALSANSPFWQGRDTGLASARMPLFQAFPRVGIPRNFGGYEGYLSAVGPLVESGAIADVSHLWWDVRPSPELGTIEVRIMDAQTGIEETQALVAFTLALAKLELEEGWASEAAIAGRETIEENRFLAARDGVEAELIDPAMRHRRPLSGIVHDLLERCADPAEELGCAAELGGIERLLREPGASRQRAIAGDPPDLGRLIEWLADAYVS